MKLKLRDGYIETMTHLMIAFGGVYDNKKKRVEYFSCGVSCSAEQTLAAIEDLQLHGINYSQCTDPARGTASTFKDTFASQQNQIEYLSSTITSNSGSPYEFLLLNDIEFGELIQFITRYDLDMKWAIERAKTRVERSDWEFQWSCRLDKYAIDSSKE